MTWKSKLTEYETGYVAGFLDGEGSISISKGSDNYYRLVVAFYNTHEPTMLYLSELLGQDYLKRTVDKRRTGLHNKNNYVLSFRKNIDTLHFLNYISEYLHIKVEQSKTALEFLDIKLNRDTWLFTEEDKLKMEEFYIKMKQLNRGTL